MLAGAAALLAPVVWQAPAGWPWWYTFVWVAAIATLTLARPSRAGVLAAAMVAAFGATTLVWANTARGRVLLAERELARLERPDPEVRALLTRFARTIADEPPELTRQGLLQAFVASDLAAAGYPTLLAAWDPAGADTLATLQTGIFAIEYDAVRRLVQQAAADGAPRAGTIQAWPAVQVAIAVPGDDGVVAAVLAPRTTLIPADPVASLVGTERGVIAESPYAIRLAAAREGGAPPRWRRDGYSIRGIVPVASAIGPVRAFVDVELRPLGALVQRGTLIVLVDLAFAGGVEDFFFDLGMDAELQADLLRELALAIVAAGFLELVEQTLHELVVGSQQGYGIGRLTLARAGLTCGGFACIARAGAALPRPRRPPPRGGSGSR